MAIAVGATIPDVRLKALTSRGIQEISTAELCRGKRVVLFGVPGAFTKTCSGHHLPGFLELAADLEAKGVDLLACAAVNDVHVLAAWSEAHAVGDQILLLADGNGDLARAMGLERDFRPSGMGIRSERYAAIIDDGVIRTLALDPPGEVNGSGAAAVLHTLEGLPR
ncbi:MAG TPA: peroxiredoxin [Thermoanaerobaculia bacterium]|nr:peroxiredoxin [Thermoanaerobaculia bacterium]